MATHYKESDLEWECCSKCRELDGFQGAKGCGDRGCICHVLTELMKKMETHRQSYPLVYSYLEQHAYNAAITRCIALVKEALKDSKK